VSEWASTTPSGDRATDSHLRHDLTSSTTRFMRRTQSFTVGPARPGAATDSLEHTHTHTHNEQYLSHSLPPSRLRRHAGGLVVGLVCLLSLSLSLSLFHCECACFRVFFCAQGRHVCQQNNSKCCERTTVKFYTWGSSSWNTQVKCKFGKWFGSLNRIIIRTKPDDCTGSR